ncbi:MAG: hypothetical protein AUH77_05785 [Candidatus Rokubacteria bacterium 13_1_40CM_4_69_39]|nr:MAG: hypothetical protein AUH77_05785 [Candidatus Rokubacteria bacterium 13_1_40CM_4_69_39]
MGGRLGAALGGVLHIVPPEAEDVARRPRNRRLETDLRRGRPELLGGEAVDALALPYREPVLERLARAGARIVAPGDQLEHRPEPPARRGPGEAALAGEVNGQRTEVEDRVGGERANARVRGSLPVGHQSHGSPPPRGERPGNDRYRD